MTKRKRGRQTGQVLPRTTPTPLAPPAPPAITAPPQQVIAPHVPLPADVPHPPEQPHPPAAPPAPQPAQPSQSEPAAPEPAAPEPAQPPLTRTQRELIERLGTRTMACNTAYGLLMPFLWENAGIHPAELEALALEALTHAVRAFDTTWGLDFDSFAQPHVYVHLIAVARRRRLAHRIARTLFGNLPKWAPWTDNEVQSYTQRSDLLDAIVACYQALPPSERQALDHHYDRPSLPGWLMSEAELCSIEPEPPGNQALDHILQTLLRRGVVTCVGAEA